MESILSLSLKNGKLIFIWPLDSLQCCPWCICLEPPNLLECNDTNEVVDTKLPSLLNLQSSEGRHVGVGAAHRSCHLWPWSQPCHSVQSWCDARQVCLGSSMHLLVLWSLSSWWGPAWLWNPNGSDTGSHEQGCLGPLASMHPLVSAWAINHLPSHRFMGWWWVEPPCQPNCGHW